MSNTTASLYDQVTEALHDVDCRILGCTDWRRRPYLTAADAVMAVLARDPWGQWTRAEPSSSPPDVPNIIREGEREHG